MEPVFGDIVSIMSRQTITAIVVALVMSSCASAPSQPDPDGPQAADSTVVAADSTSTAASEVDAVAAAIAEVDDRPDQVVSLGSGTFVQAAGTGKGSGYATDDGVTLNFEQANLREFLRVVFDTILHENYVVDKQVQGTVTLHTSRPVRQDVVISIVETVLHSNAAALVRDEGIYKIVPLAKAASQSQSPVVGRYASGNSRGYGVQVVPLQYASAGELQKILSSFVADGANIQADELRNVLILSGPRFRLDELLATIRTFDVDWLQGMSFGLFRLQYADASVLIEEIQAVISSDGSLQPGGNIRLLPIERLNAVLVISHQPGYIATVRKLIEQFDWGVESAAGRRLYVYDLENGTAESIAGVLQEVFGQAATSVSQSFGDGLASDVFRSAQSLSRPPPVPGASVGRIGAAQTLGGDGGILAESQSVVSIIADKDNNAILVLASQQDYRAIEAAIKRLDIAPRQVLMEATIAEVTLSDTLDYGVRWFLENGDHQLGFGAPVPTTASGDGLAFAFFDQDNDVRAFFDTLASESSVKFLSTPQVMVLDNQTANIRVGDQIPVTTRSSQSTTNPDAPIVTEVQFRDTGTLLTVTPRIKAGGQVSLDISLEVSLPGTEPAVGGGGNVAIAQRTINSSVIVQNGQTVVLGGLILENTSDSKSGIPLLMHIPLLGNLFSSTSKDVFRTELIVTMTPRVIENQREMRQITEELRRRMTKATEYENATKAKN